MSIWKELPNWFEATAYEHAEAPELEEYNRVDVKTIGDGGFIAEVWVPIVKK